MSVAAVAVAGVLALSGCAGFGGSTTLTTKVDAIRTAADGHALVAAYLGGSCDGPASLRVRESADHVDVDVRITVSGGGACDAAGHPRTVSAPLAAPLGTREVHTGGHAIDVFDGSRLRAPDPLPDGMERIAETGGVGDPASWTQTFGVPLDPAATTCPPGRGVLVVEQSPLGIGVTSVANLATAGQRRFGAVTASLYRDGAGAAAGWALVWSAFGGDIVLRSRAQCSGDHPFDGAELVTLASLLQPL